MCTNIAHRETPPVDNPKGEYWNDPTPPTPPPIVAINGQLANQLIEAMTSLGKIVSRLDERMAVVESLAARQSVPAPAPPVEVKDETVTQDGMREAMWQRAALRVHGAEPDSFLPQTPPPPAAPADKKCKTCRSADRYGPSKYCLACLQEQNKNRCPRCGNVVLEDQNGCGVCAAEARALERVKRGVRHPVGEMTHEVVEIISEGFPA